MEQNTKTIYFNPLEMINDFFEKPTLNHITFNKETNNDYEYKIIRESKHDGTIMFTCNLIEEALRPLVFKTTCYKKTMPSEAELKLIKDIKYTIGEIELKRAFGEVMIYGHKRFGQTDVISIPVKCEYIYWQK